MLDDAERLFWCLLLLFGTLLTSKFASNDRALAVAFALLMETVAVSRILVGWGLLTRDVTPRRVIRSSRYPRQIGVLSLWIGGAAFVLQIVVLVEAIPLGALGAVLLGIAVAGLALLLLTRFQPR